MDSEHQDGAASAPEAAAAEGGAPAAGAGARLRAAREALRLEIAQIAAETRIPQRHLEAIEAGNFEALPSRAYAIGFARTYAKAVRLNEASITDAVRAELADGPMRRTVVAPGMEPGDPARLPSAGLAWAAAAAGLVLMIGIFAVYNATFGAGTGPGSLLAPAPAASASAPPPSAPAPAAPAASGPVVFTALEDGVWVRLYEEGGERLFERPLAKGETLTVPPTATDPRINTGRPDALAITVGGAAIAKLSETPVTIAGAPVSAAALLARATPTQAATPGASQPTRRSGARRSSGASAGEATAPESAEPAPAAEAPASEPASASAPARTPGR
jgi:cytoskeletal protein RodZ